MAKDKLSSGNKRTRNFYTIVYPESAPSNWIEILQEQFIPAFVSPLHDSDCDSDGVVKKAHYHVVLMFDSVKTFEQAREIINLIGGVGLDRVNSIKGYSRYLCHLDNPDKFKYNIDEVIQLCGADYNDIISIKSDKYTCIMEMVAYCEDNKVYSYAKLLKYSMNNNVEWFKCLCDNGTYVMREFVKSSHWTSKIDDLDNNIGNI